MKKCNCINVLPGSYDNQIQIDNLPEHMKSYKRNQGGVPNSICIDTCIGEEVIELWAKGITTTGCCCGHNIDSSMPYIGVIESDIQKMKDMGYEVQPNLLGPEREDGFKPKTLFEQN